MDLSTRFSGYVADADLALDGPALLEDGGLATAVILSLYSDRQAAADDALPGADTDRRGWWGDVAPLADDYQLGSRLWLLAREKQLPVVLARAQAYAQEALAWLVTSGAAASVLVEASNPRTGVLALAIQIERPVGAVETYQYLWEWERDAL